MSGPTITAMAGQPSHTVCDFWLSPGATWGLLGFFAAARIARLDE